LLIGDTLQAVIADRNLVAVLRQVLDLFSLYHKTSGLTPYYGCLVSLVSLLTRFSCLF